MDKIVIKKAADCFRTDEKTIVTFCNDFFSAPDVCEALKIMLDFVETHEADPELLPDFLNYMNNRGESNGT